ncbi:MAG: NAD(P)H-hydrate dehydratase [archaeon]
MATETTVIRITKQLVKKALPLRDRGAHKGDFGRVLIIGGSEDYAGAPIMAALGIAALRGGADLVTLSCPSKVSWAANALIPDLITVKLSGKVIGPTHLDRLRRLAARSDVILIGPGMGRHPGGSRVVSALLRLPKRKVVDADAIKLARLQDARETLFTPHLKEYALLLERSGLSRQDIPRKLGTNTILLKGKEDSILSLTEQATCRGGSPGMTKGGTGDVLAGLCAGLLASNDSCSLFHAACAASYLNKRAGEMLENTRGQGMLASELPAMVARIIKKEFS